MEAGRTPGITALPPTTLTTQPELSIAQAPCLHVPADAAQTLLLGWDREGAGVVGKCMGKGGVTQATLGLCAIPHQGRSQLNLLRAQGQQRLLWDGRAPQRPPRETAYSGQSWARGGKKGTFRKHPRSHPASESPLCSVLIPTVRFRVTQLLSEGAGLNQVCPNRGP